MEEKIALLEDAGRFINPFETLVFPGGEKKRNDILQMAVLEPEL